jgi:cytochrome c oxidase assembly protein subunit 15
MTLNEFKFIFWWEYGHRVLGRFIGILFIIPFIFFFIKKCFSQKDLYSYLFLLFLGGTQGLIGWWMVKSGLDLNPYVSHFRLAVHLLIAQIILSFIIFLFLKRVNSQDYERINISHSSLFLIFSCSIFITVTYGAFMAGLDAGQSFNTWPKMGETFFPEGLFFIEEKYLGVFENSIFIHFFHRSLAYLCVAIILIISILHFKKIKYGAQKIHFILIILLVIIQVIIGIYVVLSNVIISLGSIHQIVGSLLFALTFSYFLLLKRRKI